MGVTNSGFKLSVISSVIPSFVLKFPPCLSTLYRMQKVSDFDCLSRFGKFSQANLKISLY